MSIVQVLSPFLFFFAPLGGIKRLRGVIRLIDVKLLCSYHPWVLSFCHPCDNYHNRLLYIYVTIFFIFKYAVIFVLYIAVVENANCTFYV